MSAVNITVPKLGNSLIIPLQGQSQRARKHTKVGLRKETSDTGTFLGVVASAEKLAKSLLHSLLASCQTCWKQKALCCRDGSLASQKGHWSHNMFMFSHIYMLSIIKDSLPGQTQVTLVLSLCVQNFVYKVCHFHLPSPCGRNAPCAAPCIPLAQTQSCPMKRVAGESGRSGNSLLPPPALLIFSNSRIWSCLAGAVDEGASCEELRVGRQRDHQLWCILPSTSSRVPGFQDPAGPTRALNLFIIEPHMEKATQNKQGHDELCQVIRNRMCTLPPTLSPVQ